MSFWDDIGRSIGDTFGGVYHAITGTPNASQRREQATLVNDQVRAYKEQSELTRAELSRKRGEEVAEKRRIEQKQIRSLRRNYRPAGFLDNQNASTAQGLSNKLGG